MPLISKNAISTILPLHQLYHEYFLITDHFPVYSNWIFGHQRLLVSVHVQFLHFLTNLILGLSCKVDFHRYRSDQKVVHFLREDGFNFINDNSF